MGMFGLTNCENCGEPLGNHKFGKCQSCQEEYEKQKEELRIEQEVKRRVKIEINKLTKKIETLIVRDIDEKEYKLKGYWEDNIFNIINY